MKSLWRISSEAERLYKLSSKTGNFYRNPSEKWSCLWKWYCRSI